MSGYSCKLQKTFEIEEGHILPIVRITNVKLENFKCVKHGEIVFNCGKKHIPADTISDVLGIYGQNGSGKTSIIEAMSILKYALMGGKIPEEYARCVDTNEKCARLEFTFDFQYPEADYKKRTVVYSFKIIAEENKVYEGDNEYEIRYKTRNPRKVAIIDERVSVSGELGGKIQKLQPIITTDESSSFPFGPSRKISALIGKKKIRLTADFVIAKMMARKESKSFIFCDETQKLFRENGRYTEQYQVLLELSYYGNFFLFVIDKRRSSVDSLFIPFNTRSGIITFRINKAAIMEKEVFASLKQYSTSINTVLSHMIPGMQLVFVESREGIDELPVIDGKPNKDELTAVRLYSKRGDTTLPLHYESEGIIKLVGILSLIISAFNDNSCTVAIDELDAGIYEFLLGEVLTVFEQYGRGQLVFTSHNLRPLEVLRKENLIFTTSNPDRRYISLRGVGKTNNLRNLYLSEIMDCNQPEEIYSSVKRYRLVAAFQKAGVNNGEE